MKLDTMVEHFAEAVAAASKRFAEALDRELVFAVLDGYPCEDITIIDRQYEFAHEIYYDPLHELIDAPYNTYPDFSRAKLLSRVTMGPV